MRRSECHKDLRSRLLSLSKVDMSAIHWGQQLCSTGMGETRGHPSFTTCAPHVQRPKQQHSCWFEGSIPSFGHHSDWLRLLATNPGGVSHSPGPHPGRSNNHTFPLSLPNPSWQNCWAVPRWTLCLVLANLELVCLQPLSASGKVCLLSVLGINPGPQAWEASAPSLS